MARSEKRAERFRTKKSLRQAGTRDANDGHSDPQGAAAQSDFGESVVEHGQGDEGAAQDADQAGDYLATIGQYDGVVEVEVVHQQHEDADDQADASQAIFVKQIDVGVGRCSRPKHHCQHKTEGDK